MQGLHDSGQLSALYAVSALVTQATDLHQLTQEFANLIRTIVGCDGAAVRWADQRNERYMLLAADGLPPAFMHHEQHLPTGACFCGQREGEAEFKVTRVPGADTDLPYCHQAGFKTVVSIPIEFQQRLLGEVTLFYKEEARIPEALQGLVMTVVRLLAGAMESLRLTALEREAAVSAERQLIARELHDSIAQSLAFLKLQVGLLKTASQDEGGVRVPAYIAELEAGISDCLVDVRELLVHFRTRPRDEDIEMALRTTLSKFEHQAGLPTELLLNGHGVALPPDVQVQVLHIVQEALSNVRKHARATRVSVRVRRQPFWRFEVRDDGVGFDPSGVLTACELHVGLDIMRERAARIGGSLRIESGRGAGCSVVLELAAPSVRIGLGGQPSIVYSLT